MNIFEGSRRIAKVIAALIVIGFGVNAYSIFYRGHLTTAVPITYSMSELDATPIRVQRCETGSLAETKTVKASSDHTVVLTLCFSFPKINASLDLDEALDLFENKQRLAYTGGTKYPPKGFTIDTDGLHEVSMVQFKEEYPQFRKLTDRQVADRWHQKFYKNMLLVDFEKKIKFGGNSLADSTITKPINYEKLAATYGGIFVDQKRIDNFKIPQSDNDYIVGQVRLGLLRTGGSMLLQLFATLFGFWIFVGITGWIVRGFMGIPRGQDDKPQR